jgi:hypothetical protein
MLVGCATSGPDVRPVLPAPPAHFGRPVSVRPPVAGEDARAYAAREKAGRLVANGRLRDDESFYGDVQKDFGRAP